MHKDVQQDKPETCPKCGMKLVEADMKMPARHAMQGVAGGFLRLIFQSFDINNCHMLIRHPEP